MGGWVEGGGEVGWTLTAARIKVVIGMVAIIIAIIVAAGIICILISIASATFICMYISNFYV